jgi:Tfp pilus assembly PilM family ATPase
MLNIAINIGSYSVKFLTFKTDRKKISYLSSEEVVLDSDEYNVMEEDIILDLQMKIISEFVKKTNQETKIILNTSSEIITERFINLPLKNKKKANLMVPFQLEEDIPYSLSDCKISNTLEITKNGSRAVVNIIRHDHLRPFFNKMRDYSIIPSVLTSEVSSIESFVKNTKEVLPQAFCIIDIGHFTTHAYFFMDGELKTTHTSYIAGLAINEMISKSYDISLEEASIYKHQNSFFLSDSQYKDVDEGQRNFAKLMDDTFSPLMSEFQRWHIGFRLQDGLSITDIFTIGGSSNIKNLSTYIHEKTGVKVGKMNFFEESSTTKIDNDDKQKRKFAMANMQAYGLVNKSKIINFLTGEYAIHGEADIPLHSMTFITARTLALSMVVIFGFIIQSIYLSINLDSADKKLAGLVKNPILKLSPRQSRSVKNQPAPILAKLKRQKKSIDQEVKVLQSSVQTNALVSLEKLSHLTSGLKIEIIQFQSTSQGDYVAVFKSEDDKSINDLKNILESSSLLNSTIDTNLAKKTLTLNATQGN